MTMMDTTMMDMLTIVTDTKIRGTKKIVVRLTNNLVFEIFMGFLLGLDVGVWFSMLEKLSLKFRTRSSGIFFGSFLTGMKY